MGIRHLYPPHRSLQIPIKIAKKSCFFALAAFLRRDNIVRKPSKKSGALDLYFFFPKLKNLLKSVDGARRTELRSTISERRGSPQTLHQQMSNFTRRLMYTKKTLLCCARIFFCTPTPRLWRTVPTDLRM